MSIACLFRSSLLGVAAIAVFALAAPLWAQSEPRRSDHTEALRECQSITGTSERLACFDSAVGAMLDATAQGELRLVDREEVQDTRRRLFGFSLPDLGIFNSGADGQDDEIDLLQSNISRIHSVQRRTVVFEIEEGSVWQINSAPAWLIRRMEAGTPVEFKKAALGSFFIRIDGQTGIKGRRVQ